MLQNIPNQHMLFFSKGVACAGLEKRGQILSRQLVSVTVSVMVCFHYSVKSALSAIGNATMPLLWGMSNLGQITPLKTMFTPCLRFIFFTAVIMKACKVHLLLHMIFSMTSDFSSVIQQFSEHLKFA